MLGKSQGGGGDGLYASTSQSTFSHGTDTTCELCRNDRRCFERFGLVACRGCLHELLP